MNRYLLDTNHLSPLVTTNHPLRNRIQNMIEVGERFAVPSVVLHEFLFGIGTIKRAKQNLAEWSSIRDGFGVYNIDAEIADSSAKLRIKLRKQGWQLGGIDSMIAIIALRNQFILLTTDKDFQGVPDLQIENWYAE